MEFCVYKKCSFSEILGLWLLTKMNLISIRLLYNIQLNKMKVIFLICLLLCLCTETLFAQENRYDVAVSGGFYLAPNYENAVSKTFMAADFNYLLSKKWTFTSGFLSGRFTYFEDWRSNTFSYDDHTNAEGYESHFYFTAAYSVIHTNQFLVQVGSGIGLFTQRLKYSYREPSSGGSPRGYGGNIFIAEESYSVPELPIRIEGSYRLGRWISVGLKGGTFLHKGPSLIGTYIGPQLRIHL